MKNSIIRESARDALALGGWAFCILVIARATIGEYMQYVSQIILAIILSSLLAFAVRGSETRISRALILAFFTIVFYNDLKFTIFAAFVVVILFLSAIVLEIKKESIIKGSILGVISSGLIFWLFKIINTPYLQ